MLSLGASSVVGQGANGLLDGPDASDPSPLPSFLEACARLAIEAAARGDFARARELMERAERVASLRSAPPRPTRG